MKLETSQIKNIGSDFPYQLYFKEIINSEVFKDVSDKEHMLHLLVEEVKNKIGDKERRYFWLQKKFFSNKCSWCDLQVREKALISTSGPQKEKFCTDCVDQLGIYKQSEQMNVFLNGEELYTPAITLYFNDPQNSSVKKPFSLEYVWSHFNRISGLNTSNLCELVRGMEQTKIEIPYIDDYEDAKRKVKFIFFGDPDEHNINPEANETKLSQQNRIQEECKSCSSGKIQGSVNLREKGNQDLIETASQDFGEQRS